MNISFVLKHKGEVSYLYTDLPISQAVRELIASGFTAIPIIDRGGKYIGTVCEGDFLRMMLRYKAQELDQMNLGDMPRRFSHRMASIDADMDDLVDLIRTQNFVPVADGRGMFIGIVTRHNILEHLGTATK